MSICILVPSRGRPKRAATLVRSIRATATQTVGIRVLVDPDDPELSAYRPAGLHILPKPMGYTVALNHAARETWDEYSIVAAFGDDVVFRTPGWDRVVEETLATPGIAYGDDLIHGVNHPSAVFMSSVIAKALGWLALPATSHQWADDGWKRLGQETDTLRFMEGVIVEHEHPAVGKAEWDATYAGVFDDARAKGDFDGFTAWTEAGLAEDAAKVRTVL